MSMYSSWRRLWREGIAPVTRILRLDAGQWSASRSGLFTPREMTSRFHLNRRLDRHHSRSGRFGAENIFYRCLESNPEHLVKQSTRRHVPVTHIFNMHRGDCSTSLVQFYMGQQYVLRKRRCVLLCRCVVYVCVCVCVVCVSVCVCGVCVVW